MIIANAVCKRYPEGLEALRDVSFTLEAGEMVFITGHSGAGKSTLFRLLAAIERPTSGSIVVNGQNLSALRRSAIPYLRRNFGLIFQDQDMQLFARLGIKPEEREEHAEEVHQAAIEQALVEQRDSKLFYDAASV